MFRSSLKIGLTLFQSTLTRKFSTTHSLEILRAILIRGGTKQQQLKELAQIDHELGNTTSALLKNNDMIMFLNYRGHLGNESFEALQASAKNQNTLQIRSFQKDRFAIEPAEHTHSLKRK